MDENPVIHLNGTLHPLTPGLNVLTLLQTLGMAEIPVLVEHNTTALFPREFPTTALSPGDRLEIIRIVAGG